LLITNPGGAYLDLTAGGGGHLKAFADRLENEASLFGLDVDSGALERTTATLSGIAQKLKLVKAAFADIGNEIDEFSDEQFDGILIDLGISSDQLDNPERGISFRFEGPLDMRLNPTTGKTATDLIAELSESELTEIIRKYGEERHASRIAKALVKERQDNMIHTTGQLRQIVLSVIRPPYQNKSLARVFQSFRIAVNDELGQLEKVLPAAINLLKTEGRLAVISYHSLEDRIVKQFFRKKASGECTCPTGLPKCLCGAKPSIKLITRKPVVPDDDEIEKNQRARSAHLRVAEKLA